MKSDNPKLSYIKLYRLPVHDWPYFVKFCVSPFCSFVTVGGVLSPESHDFSHDEGFDSEDDSDHYEDFSSDAGWCIYIYVHVYTKVFHSPTPQCSSKMTGCRS
jgi:hypothetical protein